MTTIIISQEPSDTDAVLSGLHHDVTWLLEISNEDPGSFVGREAELYSIMNALQLVTGRFARVAPRAANDISFDAQLTLVESALNPSGVA